MSEIRSIKKTKGRKPNVFKVAGSSDTKKQKPGPKASFHKRPRNSSNKLEPKYKKRAVTKSELDQMGRFSTVMSVINVKIDPFTIEGDERDILDRLIGNFSDVGNKKLNDAQCSLIFNDYLVSGLKGKKAKSMLGIHGSKRLINLKHDVGAEKDAAQNRFEISADKIQKNFNPQVKASSNKLLELLESARNSPFLTRENRQQFIKRAKNTASSVEFPPVDTIDLQEKITQVIRPQLIKNEYDLSKDMSRVQKAKLLRLVDKYANNWDRIGREFPEFAQEDLKQHWRLLKASMRADLGETNQQATNMTCSEWIKRAVKKLEGIKTRKRTKQIVTVIDASHGAKRASTLDFLASLGRNFSLPCGIEGHGSIVPSENSLFKPFQRSQSESEETQPSVKGRAFSVG